MAAFARPLGCFGRKSRSPSAAARTARPLPYLETVWLPHYHVRIETVLKGACSDVDTLVGGHEGGFAVMDLADVPDLVDVDELAFRPAIDEAKAIEIARTGLMTALMRSPGWRARPTVGPVRHIELLQYPFWVYYYQRRRSRLDIKVLDAVTGQMPGPKLKCAILTAFVDATETR